MDVLEEEGSGQKVSETCLMTCVLIKLTTAMTDQGRKTHVGLVRCEAVEDAGGQDDEVVLLQLDAHPLVALVPHVEVALAAPDVPNLLVLV